jgi:CxxC-x17-CxxC domain-containing protein
MAFNSRPGGRGGFKSFGGGNGGHGGGRFGGGNGGGFGGKAQMHPAVCTKCGKDCEVPFRPTGSRPIFCLDCFDRPQGNGGAGGSFSKPRFDDRPRHEHAPAAGNTSEMKEQLDRMNSKLDKMFNMLNDLMGKAPQKKSEDKAPAETAAPAAKADKKKAAPKKATKKAKK